MGINDRSDGIGGVMKAVHKFKAESHQESGAQQNVRPSGAQLDVSEVAGDAIPDEDQPGEKHQAEDQCANAAGPTTEFCLYNGRCGRYGHVSPNENKECAPEGAKAGTRLYEGFVNGR